MKWAGYFMGVRWLDIGFEKILDFIDCSIFFSTRRDSCKRVYTVLQMYGGGFYSHVCFGLNDKIYLYGFLILIRYWHLTFERFKMFYLNSSRI